MINKAENEVGKYSDNTSKQTIIERMQVSSKPDIRSVMVFVRVNKQAMFAIFGFSTCNNDWKSAIGNKKQ